MTVRTLTAKVPSITLVEGMILRLEAISPTTGAAIGGVSASRWSIYGKTATEAADLDAQATGPYMLVPGPAPLSSSPLPIVGGL